MRPEIREIGPLELKIPFREDSLQECVGKLGNGGLVMQAGSDGINGDHWYGWGPAPNKKRES